MGRVNTTWGQLDKGIDVPTDEQHTLVVERNYADVIEVDERQFLDGSSVLLPIATTPTDERALLAQSGLSVMAHALRFAKAHGDRKLCVLAYDSDKDIGRAQVVSTRRADNVLAYLQGDKTAFAKSAFFTGNQTTRLLLHWAHLRFDYDCDPVVPRSTHPDDGSRAIESALKRFREAHGTRTGAQVTGGPTIGQADLEAFFDLYDEALASLLEVEVADLAGFRSALVFTSPAQLGAGNRFPLPTGQGALELVSASNRRVDLVFFDTGSPIPDLTVSPAGASVRADERFARLTFLPPEPPPPVTAVRLTGMFFDTNKCFLLKSAMRGLRKLVSIYLEHPQGELLIVGHTDRAGRPDFNDTLSLERAKAVAAFLTDDVDSWLAFYGSGKPQAKRWGKTEDDQMLSALPDAATHFAATNPIQSYQASRGLEDDGIMGPNTRKQLIADYMALDGTTLPDGITPVVHGCGESFPAVETEDGIEQDENRRVELFLFDDAIDPPPPGEISKPGSPEYKKWRGHVVEEFGFETADQRDFEIALRLNRDVDTIDDSGYALDGADGEVARLLSTDADVIEDGLRGLRFFAFRKIPLGSYSLHQLAGEEKIRVLVGITVEPDGVFVHGQPLSQNESFVASEPLPFEPTVPEPVSDEIELLC